MYVFLILKIRQFFKIKFLFLRLFISDLSSLFIKGAEIPFCFIVKNSDVKKVLVLLETMIQFIMELITRHIFINLMV